MQSAEKKLLSEDKTVKLFKCLRTDIMRSIFSARFLISVIGYGVLLIANIPVDPWPTDAAYIFSLSYKYGFYIFFFLCAAIPYSMAFIKDTENGYLKSYLSRVSPNVYGLSKCIATVLSGMLAVTLSTVIFIAFLNIKFGSTDVNSISFSGWDTIITENGTLAYYAVKTFLTALYGGSFALLSLTVSTKIRNSFVIPALPVLIYYALNELSILLKLPLWCDLSSMIYIPIKPDDLLFSLLYVTLIFSALCIVLCIIFLRSLRKNGCCA